MLECKYIRWISIFFLLSELIDTCWNVNMLVVQELKDGDGELIDTCWNVNKMEN